MANQLKLNNVTFSVGDTIRVYQKIQEGDKIRTQPFEGIVISIKGKGENKMFTVRRIATGRIGVERIWPAFSPWIKKIEVRKKGKVRRAKLYYLRKRTGRRAEKIRTRKRPSFSKASITKEITADEETRDEAKEPRQTRRRTSRQTVKKE